MTSSASEAGKGDDYRPVDRKAYDQGHQRIWPTPPTDCQSCRDRLNGGHTCREREIRDERKR